MIMMVETRLLAGFMLLGFIVGLIAGGYRVSVEERRSDAYLHLMFTAEQRCHAVMPVADCKKMFDGGN